MFPIEEEYRKLQDAVDRIMTLNHVEKLLSHIYDEASSISAKMNAVIVLITAIFGFVAYIALR